MILLHAADSANSAGLPQQPYAVQSCSDDRPAGCWLLTAMVALRSCSWSLMVRLMIRPSSSTSSGRSAASACTDDTPMGVLS